MTKPFGLTRLQQAALTWHPNLKKKFAPRAPTPKVHQSKPDHFVPKHDWYWRGGSTGTNAALQEQAARNKAVRRKLVGFIEGEEA
jgi:hypothetical protein